VGAVLRFSGIGDDSFWLDEAHTGRFTRLGLGELWDWSDPYDRGNPPGYVTLLKGWAQVSRSDAWLRSFSALAGTLTIPATFLIGARIRNARLGLMAATLLALSGYHIRFSQEARTYALVGLVAAIAILSVAQLITEPDGDIAWRVRGSRRWNQRTRGQGLRRPVTWTDLAWFGYAAAAGLGFLFHNTAAAIPVAANLAVLVWWIRVRPKPPRFARNWIVANLAVLVIWMAWLPAFRNQLSQITSDWWVDPPTVRSVAEGIADLLAPSFGLAMPWNGPTWGAVALTAVGLVGLWIGIGALDARYRVLLWAMILTLPVVELLFSIRRPIFLTRTLVWVLVPISVGMALIADRFRARWRWPIFAGLLAIAAFGAYAYHTTYEKEQWDEAVALIQAEAGPDDIVLVQPPNTVAAFDHYLDRDAFAGEVYAAPNRLPDRTDRGSAVTDADRQLVADLAAEHDSVWLVLNHIPDTESLEPTLAAITTEETRTTLRGLIIIEFES
jgi:mannosyltransferase